MPRRITNADGPIKESADKDLAIADCTKAIELKRRLYAARQAYPQWRCLVVKDYETAEQLRGVDIAKYTDEICIVLTNKKALLTMLLRT